MFPFNFCFGSETEAFAICGECGVSKFKERSPSLQSDSNLQIESNAPLIETDTMDINHDKQHRQHALNVSSAPKLNLPVVLSEQSSLLNIPDPESINAPQKSTHYEEELGLTHYVSVHNIKAKQSSYLLSNDGAEVKSAQRSGNQNEIMIVFSPDTTQPDAINIWQSKKPLAEFETPLNSSNMISVRNTFMVADDTQGIYTFDTKRNEWDLFISYSIDIDVLYQSICFDSMRNIIYLFGEIEDWGTVIYIDLETKQTEIIKDDVDNMGTAPFMLMIEHTLNVFTGYQLHEESISDDSDSLNHSNDDDANSGCQKHFVWDYDMGEFELIFTFPRCVYGECIVYVDSKKALLLLDKDGIWIKYNNKQWTKAYDMQLRIGMHRYRNALSRYQHYLLSYGCGENEDKIFIFDVHELGEITYLESPHVHSPVFGENYKCLTEDNVLDEILIAGYVREISEFLHINVSNKIVAVIEMMHIEQYIHIISDENCHFKAVVHHILDYNYANDYC